MLSSKFRGATLALLATCVLPLSQADAQEYPNREIKAVVGFAAGSGADVLARFFAEKIREKAGVPLIVDNKPGAQSAIAAEFVARSKPDGYTMFITGGGVFTANTHLFKKLSYDPAKDFQPIAPFLTQPFILVVDTKSSFNSVADLTAHLKAKGDKAFYAAPSILPVAAAEMYKASAGLKAVQVRYRTAAEAMNDIMTGQVELYFSDPVFAIEQVKAGRLRALAVTTPKRVAPLPDLPTMTEVGVPGVEIVSWWSLWMPAGVSPDVIQKVNSWARQVVESEETKKFLSGFGAEPWSGTTEELKAHYLREVELWNKIAVMSKLEPQ